MPDRFQRVLKTWFSIFHIFHNIAFGLLKTVNLCWRHFEQILICGRLGDEWVGTMGRLSSPHFATDLPPHLTFFPLTDLICISSFCISCPKFSYFLSLLTSYSCPNVLFCFQVSFKYSTCRAMSMHLCWLLGWPSRKHSRVNLGITGV